VKATYVDARLTHYCPFNRFNLFRFLCQTLIFSAWCILLCFLFDFSCHFIEISDICVGWQWTTNVTISSLGAMTSRSWCALHCRVTVFFRPYAFVSSPSRHIWANHRATLPRDVWLRIPGITGRRMYILLQYTVTKSTQIKNVKLLKVSEMLIQLATFYNFCV